MYRNVIQNGVNSLSKMFVNAWFLSKSWKFSCNLDHTILFKLHHSMWYNHFLKECMERLQTSNVSISKVAQKSFNGKFTAKIDFLIGHFSAIRKTRKNHRNWVQTWKSWKTAFLLLKNKTKQNQRKSLFLEHSKVKFIIQISILLNCFENLKNL